MNIRSTSNQTLSQARMPRGGAESFKPSDENTLASIDSYVSTQERGDPQAFAVMAGSAAIGTALVAYGMGANAALTAGAGCLGFLGGTCLYAAAITAYGI